MTIKECIDIVDSVKVNQYSVANKVMWLSFVEGIIINDVLKTHEGYDRSYDDWTGYDADNLTVKLIAEPPYDRLYVAYLKMRIDQENGETARYNNSCATYNSYMMEYRKYYNKTHLPLTNETVGGKPHKPCVHAVGLTEAEFESLKRDLTYIMTQYFGSAVSQDKIYEAVNQYCHNNVEMLKGRDGYTPIKGVDYWTDTDKAEMVASAVPTVTDILSAELVSEQNARATADTSLSNAIASERNARIVADDAFLLRISEEEEARVEKDAELETAINGKVDKESGKGLSVLKDVSVDIYTDPSFGDMTDLGFDTYTDAGYFAATFYNPVQANERFYSKAEVDALLAGISPGGDIDLEEYVKKEDGKGLSTVASVDIMGYAEVDGSLGGETESSVIGFYNELFLTYHSGIEGSLKVYDTNQTCAVIDEKLANYPTTAEVVVGSEVEITSQKKNSEFYCNDAVTALTLNPPVGAVVGYGFYICFASGDSIDLTDFSGFDGFSNTQIKWVGDDCDVGGSFTPQTNTTYEVSFKLIHSDAGDGFYEQKYWIARVGAC